MKAFNTVVSIVLLVAVAFLLVREFSAKPGSRPTASKEEMAENLENQEFSGVRIAYINNDSLIAQYHYHQDLKAGLESKAKGLEADLAKKSQAFQENYATLEKQAANLTPSQLREAQTDLQMKQQELMNYRDQRAQELAMAEQELSRLIMGDLDTVLTELREEMDLDFILSYDMQSDVLKANESYNITDIVATRLNERYEAKNGDSDEDTK